MLFTWLLYAAVVVVDFGVKKLCWGLRLSEPTCCFHGFFVDFDELLEWVLLFFHLLDLF
jgi:hypothetical protein